jgi:F-type H+-transporting ATPase subunit b
MITGLGHIDKHKFRKFKMGLLLLLPLTVMAGAALALRLDIEMLYGYSGNCFLALGNAHFFGCPVEINGTIFLQIFIFLMLLLWLSRSLFDPILRIFDEREKRIFGAKKEALDLNLLADEKAKAFDLEYEKARDQARIVLSQLKQAMDVAQSEALAKAKTLAREKLQNAEVELAHQEQEIKAELATASKTLAHQITATLVPKIS